MRKFLKITGWILGSLLLLIVCLVIWLQTDSAKNFIRNRALSFLRGKIKTEVQIGSIDFSLPKWIELNHVFFRDQSRDTLLAVERLRVDISMLKLISGDVVIQQLELKGAHAHIYRNRPDTNFNFTYIIDAFAGRKTSVEPAPKKEEHNQAATTFEVDRVKLEDIRFRFDDETGGNSFALALEELTLRMRKTDIDKLAFKVKELSVRGLSGKFLQDSSYLPPSPPGNEAVNFQLAADNIALDKVDFYYQNKLNKFLLDLQLGHLFASAQEFDLIAEKIHVPELQLDSTDVKIYVAPGSPVPAKIDAVVDSVVQQNWRVKLDRAKLAAIHVKMDNNTRERVAYGMDYAHIDARDLNFEANDLSYTSDTISGRVHHFSLNEQGGLKLKELRTNFNYNLKGGVLDELYLETQHSVLQQYVAFNYPSIEAMQKDPGVIELNTDIRNSKIGMRDLIILNPDLRKQKFFADNADKKLNATLLADGSVRALNIKQVALSGLGNTELIASGKINGLPQPEKIFYDLNIKTLRSSHQDIAAFIPAEVEKQVRIPDAFGMNGRVKGTIKDYDVDAVVMTTDGSALLRGYFKTSGGTNREQYDLYVKTDKLDLGHILRQDSVLGRVSADITMKGTALDPKYMNASATGMIHSARLKGYDYGSIKFNGSVVAKEGKLKMNSADPNMHFDLAAEASFKNKYPAIVADLQLDSMDLQAVQLYNEPFKVRTRIHADIPVANIDYPDARIVFYQPTILMGASRYFLDSMFISSKPTGDSMQHLLVNTDVLYAELTGHVPLTKVGDLLTNSFNRHFAIADSVLKKNDNAPVVATVNTDRYDLTLDAHIFDRPLLHAFLPDLQRTDSINLSVKADLNSLIASFRTAGLSYAGTKITDIDGKINGSDSSLDYKVTVAKLSQPSVTLVNTSLTGNVLPRTITADLLIKDEAAKDRFALSAQLQINGSDQVVTLKQPLLLNYRSWAVSEPNKIVLNAKGMYAENFGISNSGRSIKINSSPLQYNAPLTARIDNFLISDITQMISAGDTLLANGIVNGTIVMKQMKPEPLLNTDVTISNLSVRNDTLGDLVAKAENRNSNDIVADVTIKGFGNDLQLKGDYFIKPVSGNNFDMQLHVNTLSLKSLEGLAAGSIYNSRGNIRGDLQLKGTADKPFMSGELRTDQLVTTVAAVGSTYRMPAEKISFSKDNIHLANFSVLDSLGNKLVVNGDIGLKKLANPDLDLTVRANKFKAVSGAKKKSSVVYGDLVVTTNLNIDGTALEPDVTGNLSIMKGTELTVVIPSQKAGVQSSDGIVEFVDMSDTLRNVVLQPEADTMPKLAFQPGSEIDVSISVDPEAEFSVIIDEATGDFIRMKGDASLNASVSPSGDLALTGNYELKDGAYQFNYNFIKRNFRIKSGSSIVFSGDPLKADMNVSAVYEAMIPPYDLIEKQVQDPAQLNYYKQRVPFNVALFLKGELLKPYISFNIELDESRIVRLPPEGAELVDAKLNQLRTDTSELNKQVFAVLLLNRFVGEDPFSSGTGTNANFIARQSVSRFLSEQLNQYAGSLIKGLELSFDLASTEDYTTGEKRNRTDLNVAASKRLLNDRLTITIGNNFELEGPQTATNSNATSYIPGNLAADYKLSSDGRYAVRIYRRNQDEGVLEGYVTETGVNFIITLEYNKFKNLFNKKKRAREREERRKKEEQDGNRTGKKEDDMAAPDSAVAGPLPPTQ